MSPISIEKFLGRKQSMQPFLKTLGIGEAKKRLRRHPEYVADHVGLRAAFPDRG